eukprot:2057461-Pyramimonas_sp.AAC.1
MAEKWQITTSRNLGYFRIDPPPTVDYSQSLPLTLRAPTRKDFCLVFSHPPSALWGADPSGSALAASVGVACRAGGV